ncbi:hypothetical protein Efla_003266 [Eimeria flavescens]
MHLQPEFPITPVTPPSRRRDGARLRLVPPPLALSCLAPLRGDQCLSSRHHSSRRRATPRPAGLPLLAPFSYPSLPGVALVPSLPASQPTCPQASYASALVSLPRPPVEPAETQHGGYPPTPSSTARAPYLVLLSLSSLSRARPPALPLQCLLVLPHRPDATAANTRAAGICSLLTSRDFTSCPRLIGIAPLFVGSRAGVLHARLARSPPRYCLGSHGLLTPEFRRAQHGGRLSTSVPHEREALWGAYALPTSNAASSSSPLPASAPQQAAASPGAVLGHSQHCTALSGSDAHMPGSTRHIHQHLPSGRPHKRHGNRPHPRNTPYTRSLLALTTSGRAIKYLTQTHFPSMHLPAPRPASAPGAPPLPSYPRTPRRLLPINAQTLSFLGRIALSVTRGPLNTTAPFGVVMGLEF